MERIIGCEKGLPEKFIAVSSSLWSSSVRSIRRKISAIKEQHLKSRGLLSIKWFSRLKHWICRLSKHEPFILRNWGPVLTQDFDKSDVIWIMKIIGYWHTCAEVTRNKKVNVYIWSWSGIRRNNRLSSPCGIHYRITCVKREAKGIKNGII